MISINDRIKYVEINEENIILATGIQLEIFPNMCGYKSFERAYKNNDPNFLVYYDSVPIGTTGLYTDLNISDKDTVWLGWYGILPEYRGKGIGKTILQDTIAEARSRGYKTFRLYTSAVLCTEACRLYDDVMDMGELYSLEEQELQRKVYSKSLTPDKVEPWNNKPLLLEQARLEEQSAYIEFQDILNNQQ